MKHTISITKDALLFFVAVVDFGSLNSVDLGRVMLLAVGDAKHVYRHFAVLFGALTPVSDRCLVLTSCDVGGFLREYSNLKLW